MQNRTETSFDMAYEYVLKHKNAKKIWKIPILFVDCTQDVA